MKRQRAISIEQRVLTLALSSLLFAICSLPLEAKVTGVCSNCHTMHNSQNGQPMARGDAPWGGTGGSAETYPSLLIASCLGCHSSTTASEAIKEIGGSKIPIVFNTVEPTFNTPKGLAGGNFYYVSTPGTGNCDNKGHNVFSTNIETNLPNPNLPPGSSTALTAQIRCAGRWGCHGHNGRQTGDTAVDDMTLAIKGAHHGNDTPPLGGSLTNVANNYRFLLGIQGREDTDWEEDVVNTSHNEYKGSTDFTTDTTISFLCGECHGEFHGVAGVDSTSPFLRHPTDVVLPSGGNKEYRNYTSYDMVAPVARPYPSYVTNHSVVTPGTDIVMCLSCHRAHASPYYKMMRWDNQGWPECLTVAPLCTINGCNVCHTNKNGSLYLNSAHGNYTPSPGYGVNRSSIAYFYYSIGNCAHCHEQHASIRGVEPAPAGGSPSKYELFQSLFVDQSGMFCYGCHKDPSVSNQISMPYQYNYSRIAGGDTNTCPNDIKEAFQFVNDTTGAPQLNCGSSAGSSHFLANIRTFLTNKGSTWNFSSTAGDNNPCSACHNPHSAEKDPHTPTGRFVGFRLVSSLSRPSLHSKDNNFWYIHCEKILPYGYRSTCRYPWSDPCLLFEPDGSTTSDGSNMVDSNFICLDCHQYQTQSTYRGTIQAIGSLFTLWTGDIHGGLGKTAYDYGDKKAPYTEGGSYSLNCLDCHEPHGSPNEYLLRQEVNGVQIPNFGTHRYYNFCQACHINMNKHMYWDEFDYNSDCWGCHRHGAGL